MLMSVLFSLPFSFQILDFFLFKRAIGWNDIISHACFIANADLVEGE